MKGCNKTLKKLKSLLIIISIILICSITQVHATDTQVGEENSETEVTNLPYIEMKVKSTKVGESNQVLVEMWGSNFTNLEGMEIVFTYNNTKLTPSVVNSNGLIDNLDSYKYEKRPTQAGDKPTSSELLEQANFDAASTDILSESFNFENEYKNLLDIDLFRYLAPNGNNEAMQFIISRKNETSEINATDPILLGKFSFSQTEGTAIEETDFATNRIKIYCDDGNTEDDYSYYVRDIANGENCTDIVEFTFEKYGSISGTVETGYFNGTSFEQIGKNIVTVKLYNASDVSDIDWTEIGVAYETNRLKLQPIIGGEYESCCRPDNSKTPEIEAVLEITTTEADLGNFKLDNVLFGEYVVVIDKLNYADYIVTGVIIDGANKDINLGNIQIEAGDLNKDGIIDKIDRTIFLRLYTNSEDIKADLGIVAFDLDDDGNEEKNSEKIDRTYMLRILSNSLNREVKISEKID